MSNSFHIVITSDASTEQNPENKAASFKMQLPNQLHLSEDWEVAMTHIIYPHTWQNIQRNQVSYLLSYRGDSSWKLPIYLPSGTYQRLEDLVNGMVTGLHSAFPDIHLKSGKHITHIGGHECFYINPKAGHYYEFALPPEFQVTLPNKLARALGYLNHEDRVPALYRITGPTSVQLNEDQSVTLTATTITMRRNDELVWGMLSSYSFQSMYIYSDLIESLVVGDVQANLLRTIVPRGRPGDMIAEEIKIPTYHRLRTSIFSALEINIRGDTGQLISFASGVERITLHFRRRTIL